MPGVSTTGVSLVSRGNLTLVELFHVTGYLGLKVSLRALDEWLCKDGSILSVIAPFQEDMNVVFHTTPMSNFGDTWGP